MLSLIIVVAQRGLLRLLQKVCDRRVLPRLILVGISSAVVYVVTFEMIGRLGAGVFDLFDYGLAPILTGALGVMVFNNLMTSRLLFAALGYGVQVGVIVSKRIAISYLWYSVG